MKMVKLIKDIWEPTDDYSLGRYLAREGEILELVASTTNRGYDYEVRHEGNIGSFLITKDECEILDA